MNTQNGQYPNSSSAQPSPYLAFYGLAREPFATPIEFDLFYPEATRIARLDILHHLTQYGNELLLVTGPEGSGKSTLLQQFTAKASNTWEIARIEAKGGIDERNLMQQFYSQLELNFHGATHPELLDQLQHHLDTLVHNSRLGVLLVDDAHQLTVTALQRILQLTTLKNFTDKPLLRVILFSEPELAEKLDDPLLAKYAELPRRTIDLPPFNEEDSVHYILHRLSAARFVASEPFSEAVLRKLYKQSQGWPGQLNALAHQKLLASLPNTERPPELPGISDKALYKPQRLVAIGSVIVILLTIIFWDVTRDLFAPSTQDRDQQALAIPTKDSLTAPAPVKPATPKPESKFEPQASQTTAQTKAPVAKATKPVIVDKPVTPVTKPPAPAPAPVPAKVARAEKKATPPKPAPKPVAKTRTPAKASDAPVSKQWHDLPDWLPKHRNAWLNARDPQHFTLQLVAGERLETLHKFIQRHKFKRQLAFYQTERNHKPWYALVYGEYPNKQSAIDARSQLPRKLRRVKPWVRNFDGIQQSLK